MDRGRAFNPAYLALLGLRRCELSGLRWSAGDFDAETASTLIARSMVMDLDQVFSF
ncbi:hypothetical protein [[Mycobacterium] fortunisiensis]|uniref:hypothetical protein n=1 Tax=[Mycobacterium] fortunisiensis TaxID=2600579 RepID=UPI001C25EF93|nr:hypothetical protein [[Mycobacterium] fortunisiensis]